MDKRVKKLEDSISQLELSIKDFDKDLKEEFITEVLKRFNFLITAESYKVSAVMHSTSMDNDDIKQDFIEYLLKYTYPEVFRRKVATGKLWIPYIKASVKNCSVNLLTKYASDTFRNPRKPYVSLDDIGDKEVPASQYFEDYDFLFSSFGYSVLKSLELEDRFLFVSLVNPSPNFLSYLKEKRKSATYLVISEYLNIPYSKVLKSVVKIKKTLEYFVPLCEV